MSTFKRLRALGEAGFAAVRGARDGLPQFERARFRALGGAGLFRGELPPQGP